MKGTPPPKAHHHHHKKAPVIVPGGPMKGGPAPKAHHKKHHHPKPKIQPGGVMKRAKHHPKRKLARSPLLSSGPWILGGNNVAGNCAAVAVANSLLLATGIRATDAELLALHDRCGPLSISEALAAVAARGLSGIRPVSFCDVSRTGLPFTARGLLLGLEMPGGSHAALGLAGGLVTWGELAGWDDELIDEAWLVTWPQTGRG